MDSVVIDCPASMAHLSPALQFPGGGHVWQVLLWGLLREQRVMQHHSVYVVHEHAAWLPEQVRFIWRP